MKGDSGPSSLEQSKGVRVVLLIPATVPAARKAETVTSPVNRIQSSPPFFFLLSHFIRDAPSHPEQLPSFYFWPFFFLSFFCETLSGRFRTSSKQASTKFQLNRNIVQNLSGWKVSQEVTWFTLVLESGSRLNSNQLPEGFVQAGLGNLWGWKFNNFLWPCILEKILLLQEGKLETD